MLKRKIKRNYGEITLELLDIILQFAGESAECFIDQESIKGKIKRADIASTRFFDYLSYLHRVGYAKIKIKNTTSKNKLLSIKLTLKGHLKLLEHSDKNKIDGKWRMLSFDIPEKLKNRRNQFRNTIKRIGFRQVQKSLWACPFIKANKVDKAINYYQLQNYVAYLIVEKSDINPFLEKMFSDILLNKKIKTE